MPDDVRQQLEDLPHALLKLDMRGRGLQTWIAQLTTDPALRDGRRSQLLEQRDAAERCLTDGSAALEAVLRELERLRAGTATVDSVSARLDAATVKTHGAPEGDRMDAGVGPSLPAATTLNTPTFAAAKRARSSGSLRLMSVLPTE